MMPSMIFVRISEPFWNHSVFVILSVIFLTRSLAVWPRVVTMLLMPWMIFVRTSAPFWNHSVFVILSQIVETILPAASKSEPIRERIPLTSD